MAKKCSTGQSCIEKEVTSYKIRTLELFFTKNWQTNMNEDDFFLYPSKSGASSQCKSKTARNC
jgi:hypothetical protein